MLRERPFAGTRAATVPRASRASKSSSCVAACIFLLIRCFVKCAALEPSSEEVRGTNATALSGLPIRLPADPRCPWLSEGVVGAARASPLVRAVVSRTRMAAPFGPGSWPDGLALADERGADAEETKKYGWTDAAVFSLTVRIDPAKAQKWLPNSLLRVRGDTARVFFAWYARRRRSRPSRHFSFVRSASASRVATSFTNRRRKTKTKKKKPAGTPTRSAAARTTRRPSCWTSRTSRPGSARTTARGCSWTRTGP